MARNMVDWEFWGSPKVWKTMGVGFLLIIVGLTLLWVGVDSGIAEAPIMIGMVIVGISTLYLVYWENWVLLRRKGKSR
ncbi:MAG: hypothetical protein JSV94_05340 [Methanobacteriota archaeon]|nr:MAG: hypothetical protein JSV94_05340 [Euryarchaeota archaeon]